MAPPTDSVPENETPFVFGVSLYALLAVAYDACTVRALAGAEPLRVSVSVGVAPEPLYVTPVTTYGGMVLGLYLVPSKFTWLYVGIKVAVPVCPWTLSSKV